MHRGGEWLEEDAQNHGRPWRRGAALAALRDHFSGSDSGPAPNHKFTPAQRMKADQQFKSKKFDRLDLFLCTVIPTKFEEFGQGLSEGCFKRPSSG